MAQPQKTSVIEQGRELGGGSKLPIRLVHDGLIVQEIYKSGTRMPTITAADEAGPGERHPIFYFRDSANGVQFCVQFPSGSVQVLATEP